MELHKFLIQYRILYIVITAFFLWLAYDAWEWFKTDHQNLREFAVAGFVSIYLSVISVLKFIIENVRRDSSHD